jgi:hypothetical protein
VALSFSWASLSQPQASVSVLDPPPNQHCERRIGGEPLLFFKALNEALTSNEFGVPLNLMGSDGKGKGLKMAHCAVSCGSDSHSR